MTRPKDNRTSLVSAAVAGRIAPPRIHPEQVAVDIEGRHRHLPGTGGIALGVHAGALVAEKIADHLMAGASIEDADGSPATAGPLHLLACVGNRVRDCAGRPIGVVAGKRGGIAPRFWAPQLVGVEVDDAVAERLVPGERIVVETCGRGLILVDHPAIALLNIAPPILDAIPLNAPGGVVSCGVVAVVAPEAAGAGIGQDGWIGDLEIASDITIEGSISALRFGDLVAFADFDATTTRHYRPGWVAIGLVSHGPGHAPGHGIGVTMLITGPAFALRPVVSGNAGLGDLLRALAQAIAQDGRS